MEYGWFLPQGEERGGICPKCPILDPPLTHGAWLGVVSRRPGLSESRLGEVMLLVVYAKTAKLFKKCNLQKPGWKGSETQGGRQCKSKNQFALLALTLLQPFVSCHHISGVEQCKNQKFCAFTSNLKYGSLNISRIKFYY